MTALLEPWLDKRKLAEHLSCSTRQVDRWILEGMPHAILAGRVKAKVSEVEAWLEGRGGLERRGTFAALEQRSVA